VEPADNSKDHKPIGIAVTDTTDTAIKVAVEGELNVLVSLENGEIKKGDAVMVSTIPGVGMKAGREGIIVGTATGNFLTTTPITTTFSLDAQEVKVGVVPIAIDIKTKVLQNKSYIPGLNANTPTKAAISILVIAFAVIMIVTLVYSAVKNSLLAVGRNPLTSGVISKHLVMVLLFAVGLLVVTLVTIFVLNR
jgi:hypothetical protein